jgi:hypothetical protein
MPAAYAGRDAANLLQFSDFAHRPSPPDQSPLVPGPIADDDLAGVSLLNIWTAALSGPRLTSIESVEDIG